MRVLDLTLSDPATNLAIDEALLEEAEASAEPSEVLRIWQFETPAVVVGRASRVHEEVCVDFCERAQIPVLRRCSGGTAVTVGPGCMLYSLIVNTDLRPNLKDLDRAHHFVMDSLSTQLGKLLAGIEFQGTCDLTWNNRKFSGNSLRVAKRHLLYHGTLLYDFPLDLIRSTLASPPRQPDYRDSRPHEDFVVNLPISADSLRNAVELAFESSVPMVEWPRERTGRLAEQRYSQREWNFRR